MKCSPASLRAQAAVWVGTLCLALVAATPSLAGDAHHVVAATSIKTSNTVPGTPVAVATHATGLVVVVTQEDDLYKLSPTGALLGSVTTLPAPGAGTPVAIEVSVAGDVYVARSNGRIDRFNSGLSHQTNVTLSGTPVSLTVSPVGGGEVYVATTDGTIHKREANLAPITTGSVPGTPTCVFTRDGADIYVTTGNATGDNVFRLASGLGPPESKGNVAGTPRGMTANSAGDVIVAVTTSLIRITPTISTLGSPLALTGPLLDVDVDDAGHVAAINSGGSISVVSPALNPASLTTVAAGTSLRSVAINLTGDIYAVGGTATVTAAITLAPPVTLAFPATAIGTTSTLPLAVTSGSSAPLTVTVSSSDTTKFDIVGSSTFSLAAGATQPVSIEFKAPAPAGSYSETITVQASVGGSMDTKTVNATATSFAPLPEACYSTSSLTFGIVNTGTNKSLPFRITNCGHLPLTISRISLSTGDPAGVWSISPQIPPDAGITLSNNGDFTDVTVTLSAPPGLTADVPYNAVITVTTNDAVNPPTKTISATGTGHLPVPIMRLESTVLDYREVELGFAFTKPVIVHNDGDAELVFDLHMHPTFSNADIPHWQAPTSGSLELGTHTIASGASPKFLLQVYEPEATGNHEIRLEVTGNDPSNPSDEIHLRGEGIPPVPMDNVLVLDRSGSMKDPAGSEKKIEAMRTAVSLYTHLVAQRNVGVPAPLGDELGYVKYNHNVAVYLPMQPLNAAHLSAAEGGLTDAALNDSSRLLPKNKTNIGGAMETAATELAGSAADRKHIMVLMTDGMKTAGPDVTESFVQNLTNTDPFLKIYSIGLGDQHDPAMLQRITNVQNGYHQVQAELTGTTRFDLEAFYFKIFANAAGMSLVVDPTHVVSLDEPPLGPVDTAHVTRSDLSASFLILDVPELRAFYDLELWDPNGNVIVPGSTIGGVAVHEMSRLTYRIVRVVFPDPSLYLSYVGDWELWIRPNGKWSPEAVKQVLVRGTNFGTDWIKPELGQAPVGFAAAVDSNYRMNVEILTNSYLPGADVTLTAELTDRGWPSPGGRVDLTARTPDGTTYPSMKMYDDGTHGDAVAGDATFTLPFPHTGQTGSYTFFYLGRGHNYYGELNTREDTRYLTLAPIPHDPGGGGDCIPCRWQYWLWALLLALMLLLLYFCRCRVVQ